MTLAPNRRWFRFTLRTLLLAVLIFGTGGYWIARHVAARSAEHAYQRAIEAWESELVLTSDVCKASANLLNADLRVPFVDREKASAAHLSRIRWVKQRIEAKSIGGYHYEDDLTTVNSVLAEANNPASD